MITIAIWSRRDPDRSSSSPIPPDPTPPTDRRLIALGDSLTAGYQLSPDESFPAQLQKLFESRGLSIQVTNAGKSGDTSAQILERLERSLAESSTGDILLVTVGANDGLQWLPIDQLETNLKKIIQTAKERWLIVIIWGMKLPLNYGIDYTKWFEAIYPRVAQETDALLIPFILEDVATIPALNLDDGIHPNAAGYQIIAKNIFTFLDQKRILTP